jgi:hypothetical protein
MITVFPVGNYYVNRFNMQLTSQDTNDDEVKDITEMPKEWFDTLSADDKSTLLILSKMSELNDEGKAFLKEQIAVAE